MFKRVNIRNAYYDLSFGKYRSNIELIDTEFSYKTFIYYKCPITDISFIELIIDVYSLKNLNVGKNLYLYLKYIGKLYNYSVIDLTKYSEECPKFKEFLPEIKKYLLFE